MRLSLRTVFAMVLVCALNARAMPGDDCQCGDVDDDRAVSVLDVATFRGALADPSGTPLSAEGLEKCNVAGGAASACNVLDVTALRRALAGLAPGVADTCVAQHGQSGQVVRFAAFGAQGKANQGQFDVADAVFETCSDRCCDFVQLLGNNFYDFGVSSPSDPLFSSAFEAPYAGIDMDFWAVLGNHDYGNPSVFPDALKAQHQIDYSSSADTRFTLPSTYWHRLVEHVHFVGLDSTVTQWDADAQQRTDVDAWLDAATSTWTISAGTQCYLSNGSHGNAGAYDGLPPILPYNIPRGAHVKSFYETLLCGRVDLALCAFDHNMQWLQATCSGTELAVAGTGSSTTELEGSQPAYFQSETLGFLWVEIDGNTLTAEFMDTSGATLFTRTLTKP